MEIPKEEPQMSQRNLTKKINLLLTDEQHTHIALLFPERGSFLYFLRRCINELIRNPEASEITVPLRFQSRNPFGDTK